MTSSIDNIKAKLVQYLEDSESLYVSEDQHDLALTRLGLDSVAAIGLGEFINESFSIKAPQSLIFDHPSINRIAAFIMESTKN